MEFGLSSRPAEAEQAATRPAGSHSIGDGGGTTDFADFTDWDGPVIAAGWRSLLPGGRLTAGDGCATFSVADYTDWDEEEPQISQISQIGANRRYAAVLVCIARRAAAHSRGRLCHSRSLASETGVLMFRLSCFAR